MTHSEKGELSNELVNQNMFCPARSSYKVEHILDLNSTFPSV